MLDLTRYSSDTHQIFYIAIKIFYDFIAFLKLTTVAQYLLIFSEAILHGIYLFLSSKDWSFYKLKNSFECYLLNQYLDKDDINIKCTLENMEFILVGLQCTPINGKFMLWNIQFTHMPMPSARRNFIFGGEKKFHQWKVKFRLQKITFIK